MSHIQQLLGKLRDKLYKVEDSGRLKNMHDRLEVREKDTHADFLDTHHPDGKRQSLLEHHAANFWHYYYPGERPTEVTADLPASGHELWTEAQHRQARERMIDPASASSITEEHSRLSDTEKTQQHWMYESMVGELALEKEEYAQAEKSFRAVLIEAERSKVPDQLLAKVLRHLARCLSAQGKYSEFEKVYERALLSDAEKQESNGHFPEEEELNHIAVNYLKEGKVEQAKELYQHILSVLERVRGEKSAVVSRCLNDLAGIYAKTEEWKKAEELLKRAIEITETSPNNLSGEMATSMYNLGSLYQKKDRSNEAQELFGRAMAILEKCSAESNGK